MFTKLTYFSCIALAAVLFVGAANADLIVAENLLVDLRADDLTEGATVTVWTNHGSATGNFVANENGDPIVVEIVNGAKAVTLNGADWFEGPVSPDGIEGAGTRSIEVWAYNPSIPQEETMVAWAHRGGPGATNMSFNYGNDPLWGAVGHWDGAVYDMGWWGAHSPAPAANTWWYLVYTYDGLDARVYVNGEQESVRYSLTLATYPDMPIKIGTQNENDTGAPSGHYFSGSLALVRIHDGVLSPADILNNFQYSPVVRASDPVPADGNAVGPDVWEENVYMILDYTPGSGAVTSTAYFSDNKQDVIDRDEAHCLGSTPPWPSTDPDAFVVGYDDPAIAEFARAPLVPGTTYYWCVDTFDGTDTWPGQVWSFTVMPKEAWGPTPADGAQLVSQNPTCAWRLGDLDITIYTLTYLVYCGTDEAAVAAIATNNTTAPQYKGTVSPATIALANLDPETEYFWRVDTLRTLARPPFTKNYTKGDVWSFTTAPPGMGSILREWWQFPTEDWNGDLNLLKNDPRYPDGPDGSELVSLFEGPTNWDPSPGDGVANSYGSRLHGWLYVLESGDYTFWIASDDAGELWLSTDSNPANASLIAYVTGWVNSRDFDDAASGGLGGSGMQSAPIHLEGGQMHYISGLMKEGGGGDNISAAWRGPDTGGVREVIPSNHLMPYVPVTAHNPDPADGWMDVPLDVTLSWTAGIDQSTGSPYTTQRVYIGGDPIAVANATTASSEYKGAPTGPNEYGPLSLSYYEQVYWRIDGVMADSGTVAYSGMVWTFKATFDPGQVVDSHLKLWLKLEDNVLDSSGYGRDGTEMGGPTYLSGYDEQAISFDGADDYVDLPIGADIASLTSSTFAAWVNFSNLGGAWQRIFDFGSGTSTYLFLCPRIGADGQIRFAIKPPDAGEQIVDTTTYLSTGWHHLAVTINAASTTANVYLDGDLVGTNAAVTLTPSDVGYSTQNWIGRSQYAADGYLNAAVDDFRIYDLAKDATGIAEIMRIDLSWAWNPDPENNAQDVARDIVLSWSPGDGATAHTIWFGADNPGNMVKVAGPQVGGTYDPPGDLNLGTTYYWAVVESPGLEMGRTWKFTTSNYIVVDDMESYVPWTQSGDHIFEAWRDAFGDCTVGNGNNTGSTLTENADPVLGGIQSMKYEFDNDGTVYSPCTMGQEGGHLKYSRIEAQVAGLPSGIGTDWTVGGVRALYLAFHGTAGNAVTEEFWVQLKSGASYGPKVFYGDYEGETLDDFNEASWHNWYIDLADFGVALNNVTSIVIGIGDEATTPYGSGTLYIDDVRLYAPICMPERAKSPADFDSSCRVDYLDVDILFENWLLRDVPETAWGGVWQSADIGDVNEPGSFSNLGGGAYSMTAGGADIWGQADAFRYAYQSISGDCQLTVHVTDIGGPSTNDWRKAGVMIRETLDANSPHAFMMITPAGGNGKAFQWRPAKGGDSSSWDGGTAVAPPMCVRIVRTGDTFRGFYYYDGEWFQQGSAVNIPMSENVYIGMALTSHDYANECTATFDRSCTDEFVPMDLSDDKTVNFIDYAVLMNQWLDKVLWP